MKVFTRLHCRLNKNKYYHQWHKNKNHGYVHVFIVLFALSLGFGLINQEINLYQRVSASSNIEKYLIVKNIDQNNIKDQLLKIDITNSYLTENNYLQLKWESSAEIDTVSIYLINNTNKLINIGQKIANRNFFSAYIPKNNYQFVQVIGFDKNNQEIANVHSEI